MKLAELLINKGADLNAASKNGITPLHNVVRYEQKEFAEFLIDKGVNVNVQAIDGNTPLDWAVYFKKIKIADLLRKHGAKTGEELKSEGK